MTKCDKSAHTNDMARSALQMQDLGLGRRLAMARDATGMSQESAAGRLDVSRATLSAWERAERDGTDTAEDDRYPPANMLRRICELYQVSADWLLWGEATRANLKGKRHLSAIDGGRTGPRDVIQAPLLR